MHASIATAATQLCITYSSLHKSYFIYIYIYKMVAEAA